MVLLKSQIVCFLKILSNILASRGDLKIVSKTNVMGMSLQKYYLFDAFGLLAEFRLHMKN